MIRSAALLSAFLVLAAAAPVAHAQDADAAAPAAAPKRRTAHPARKTDAKADAKKQDAKKAEAKKGEAKAPAGLQATPIGTFGDWGVYAAGEGKARICYAISQPQQRLPKSLKRDAAYLFVTVRKAEKVQNEVAVMMGFAAKPPASQAAAPAKPAATQTASAAPAPTPASTAADPTLTIGPAKYTLVIKETNAWLQNPADEAKVVAEMMRGKSVVVKAHSLRGNVSTDDYTLTGFGDAIKKAREECK